MSREVMRMALEVLENTRMFQQIDHRAVETIEALKVELAKPEQEPVSTAPEWDDASDAILQLNTLEALLGGRNGPSIKLRGLILKMTEDTKRLDFIGSEFTWQFVANSYLYQKRLLAEGMDSGYENLRAAIDAEMKESS